MTPSLSLSEVLQAATSSGAADPERAVLLALRRGDLEVIAQTYSQDVKLAAGRTVMTTTGLDKAVYVQLPPKFWIAQDGACQIDWDASSATSRWVEVNGEAWARSTVTATATDIFAAADVTAKLWPSPPPRRSEDVSTRERNKLLQIIVGMAMAKFSFSPGARGSAAANIEHALSLKGIDVHEDTIRKYLSEAVEKGLHGG